MAQFSKLKVDHYLKQRLTRRQAMRAGGIAALGLAFSKPIIQTIRPTPAWAQVSPGPTPPPVKPTIVVVTPSDLVGPTDPAGWRFIDEGVAGSTGSLISGPGSPPNGSGSAGFVLTDANQGMSPQYFAAGIVGLPFSSITCLNYCTYVSAAPGQQAVALQINFDSDVTDASTSWQGRLVFEPLNSGTVTPGTWQCWDTLSGKWWATGSPVNGFAPQSSPQTLADILALYPNAGFNSSFGGLLVKAGSGWSSFTGSADGIKLGINGSDTIFDFEA